MANVGMRSRLRVPTSQRIAGHSTSSALEAGTDAYQRGDEMMSIHRPPASLR
jgi:hypothetical protein